jgi:superfamily II DNA or RNA helicase
VKLEEVKPGVLIAGPKWPEPVEVSKVENCGNYLRLIGATKSGKHVDQVISISELNNVRIIQIRVDFGAESWKAFLALETIRYRFASLYDPLLAMNTSKVDPLPHQIEAVYGYVLKLPRIRFLIADDPGAGKTIMAGLIIKELKLRRIAKRFLLVVPGHLRDQWLRELKDRFEESFTFVDRSYMDAHYAENVWEKENQIVTSIDFAKQEEILPAISSAFFDMIIVDEAHKMSAYRYGDKTSKTDRYELGEVLSKITEHFLFLTATPHKGDPENFRLLIDLLEPGFFADAKMLSESIENKDNPLFIRRIKEDLKDFEGNPLFLPRYVKTVAFNLSPEEKMLYNSVSQYVNEQYNKALSKDKRRNVAFALIILQRRIASSTYALLRSLTRRRERLQGLMDIALNEEMPQPNATFNFEEVEDEGEEERWREEELWETLSVAENREQLQNEISTLNELIEKAKVLIEGENEVKLQQLKKTMQDFQQKFPGEKVLIFTESKDTLEYLEKRIRSWGYLVNVIHGGMRLEDRVAAETIFKNETQVMVATEAAGEGINLQFCHLMINYDLPWNPNRLEQRMGRIHRYGQTKEVYIFNLVAADTREGMVLKKLFDKLDEIREVMKSDRVFDVISEVLYGKDLSLLLLEAAASARGMDEILRELDVHVDAEYIKKVKENLGESLATKYIDYTRIREMAEKAREHRLIPEYTKSFFIKAFLKSGGALRERKDGFVAVDSIPYEIRSIAGEDAFRRRYGYLLRAYPKITFDKDVAFKNPDAEFVSFGHPLFEAMLDWVEKTFSGDLMKGSTFIDPAGTLSGHLLFYEGEITDGTAEVAGRKIFTYHVNDKNVVKSISSAVLWDLAESPSNAQHSSGLLTNVEALKNAVFQASVTELEKYLSQLQEERERQAKIKIKYGVKSLDKLVVKLDGDLIALYDRKSRGENVDLVMRNKDEQKKKYEDAKRELEDILEKERNLTMSTPKFIGIVRVLSSPHIEDAMKSDKEMERIGMEVAMKYEICEGRFPENVATEDLGFDIRSRDIDGKVVRYIEVKARAQTGAVALTQNEWFKAQRLNKDYYLYAIMNAGTHNPALFMINDPVANLNAIERIEAVRFIISAEELLLKGLRT